MDTMDRERIKQCLTAKAELLRIIAHPVRLCLLAKLILEGQSNVTELQCCIDVSQPSVSQHLSKLKAAGILTAQRNGTEMIYRITNEEIRDIVNLLLQDC